MEIVRPINGELQTTGVASGDGTIQARDRTLSTRTRRPALDAARPRGSLDHRVRRAVDDHAVTRARPDDESARDASPSGRDASGVSVAFRGRQGDDAGRAA